MYDLDFSYNARRALKNNLITLGYFYHKNNSVRKIFIKKKVFIMSFLDWYKNKNNTQRIILKKNIIEWHHIGLKKLPSYEYDDQDDEYYLNNQKYLGCYFVQPFLIKNFLKDYKKNI